MTDILTYDIHGFVISIEGIANREFIKEYKWASVEKDLKPDLSVRLYHGKEDLPTKLSGCKKGFYISFGEEGNIIWYQRGISPKSILFYCEGLLHWSDKSLLHAGAVTRNGEAFVFTGGGGVGKTSIVLNLLQKGFQYLSDDWLVIDGEKAYPMPKLLHIFDYNFKNKDIAKRILGFKRFFYFPYFLLLRSAREHFPNRYVRYALDVFKPMFRTNICKLRPDAKISPPTRISKIFYLERGDVKDILTDTEISIQEIARRMAYVNLYEWNFVFHEYYKYVYLFGVKNKIIENRFVHDYNIIYKSLKNTAVSKVLVPREMDLSEMDIISLLDL